MTRLFLAAAGCVLAAAAARAHHIWIVPASADGSKATAVFSDDLNPSSPDSLRKVAHARLYVRDRAGAEELVEWARGEASFALDVPGKGGRTVGGVCVYGVETYDHRLHKHIDPYLLTYYPKTILGVGGDPKPWDRLPLEILSTRTADGVRLQVFFRGKPAPKAELFVLGGKDGKVELKTDEKGETTFAPKAAGPYGFRTRFIEAKAGEHNGKKYGEVRHYASLVLRLDGGK
jgi:hypothetical protein